MKRFDIVHFTVLAVLALFIWLRSTGWISSADDTLPILIALPLFVWIGMPWKFRDTPLPLPIQWVTIAVLLFLIGIGLDLTFFLTCGWCALLWAWISSNVTPESLPHIAKLMVLPMMAFPWISLDLVSLGWWFRLSGAWTTAQAFTLLGANVEQLGTNLKINGLPISVEVACAGLNTLQSMLIAGSVAAYIILEKSNRYWWSLPILFGMAWVSNTLRIIILSVAALIVSPEFAVGAFHTWGGWLILVVMFCLCWAIFSLMEPKDPKPDESAHE